MGPQPLLLVTALAHAVFWVMVGIRILASRSAGGDVAPASEHPDDRSARGAFALVTVSQLAFYPLVVAWWADPAWAGPALLPSTLPIQVAGVVLITGGLLLVAWAYVSFRSFRLLARIDPGHELCDKGPFAWFRHPVYAGIDLLYLGSFLLIPHALLLVQFVANAIAYDHRGRIEERVLVRAFGDRYRAHMKRTFRRIPGIY